MVQVSASLVHGLTVHAATWERDQEDDVLASVDSCCCSSETHEGAQAETSRAHNKVEDRPWRLGEPQGISTHATVAEIFQLKSTKSCFKLITKQCMQVEVLSGRDRGKQGHVAVVARRLNKVIVQGLNTVG